MQNVLMVLLGACSVLVLGMVCENLMVWLLRPARRRYSITVLPVFGDGVDIERQMRWQYFCMQSHPCRRGDRLLIVDCGVTEQALQKAEMFCRGKMDVMICTGDQLKQIIRNDAVYKAVEVVLY